MSKKTTVAQNAAYILKFEGISLNKLLGVVFVYSIMFQPPSYCVAMLKVTLVGCLVALENT